MKVYPREFFYGKQNKLLSDYQVFDRIPWFTGAMDVGKSGYWHSFAYLNGTLIAGTRYDDTKYKLSWLFAAEFSFDLEPCM